MLERSARQLRKINEFGRGGGGRLLRSAKKIHRGKPAHEIYSLAAPPRTAARPHVTATPPRRTSCDLLRRPNTGAAAAFGPLSGAGGEGCALGGELRDL